VSPFSISLPGILFGSLIQNQLVSYVPLVIALRYVLEALKQPISTNLFKFGFYALEQFIPRLPEWPQYCAHLRQVRVLTLLALLFLLVAFPVIILF
jgi:CCR4-NOT transcription complex subunit 1